VAKKVRPAVRREPSPSAGEEAAIRADSRWLRLPLWGAAVLVLQLGLMLSVFNRAAHNGGDTAGYVTLAHSLLEQGTYTDLWHPGQPPHTKYPPVFPALLAVAITLGARTWAALKVVPALFTTLSVMAVYLWAKGRRGAPFGALVALLTAACNAVLWSSHWELSDPPFLALTFLSLWVYDRALVPAAAVAPPGTELRAGHKTAWLTAGAVATGLAYFTRSAGLPLLVAAGVWLLVKKKVRAAAALTASVGGLGLLWSLRGGQGAQYVSEFWMIDPYQPELGRVGLANLVQRVVENAGSYMTVHVPVGLTGLRAGVFVGFLGIVLFALAGWGWARRLRQRPGVAELFMPLYLGLILLWPQVWSGDRFALPLFPLLLFYSGEVILHLTERVPAPARKLVMGASVAVLAFPALASWSRDVRVGSGCSAVVHSEGAFACWGPRNTQFVQAALWSGAHLPEGSVVLSRKPRIFYVMSGVASQTFPFTKDGTRFLAIADSLGARYLVMDYLDAAASVYVADVLVQRGGAFCALEEFGRPGQAPTQLLGIVLPELRGMVATEEGADGMVTVAMDRCPAELVRPVPLAERSERSEEIPLLVGFR
jgi:4-amino-4-deoxy-L-arabinose transferase-like glycosyltransferase